MSTGIRSTTARLPSLRRSLWEAVAVTVLSAVVALAFNALRPSGLALVAQVPYQTLVPCPEPGGPVTALDADDPVVPAARSFLVDARPRRDFDLRHLERAVNVPYDWLDPVPQQLLEELAGEIAASGATRVVVYGDGGRPDSGEHLGKEISGRGIKNVCFVRGGAPAVFAAEAP